jgi:hypothetical protein
MRRELANTETREMLKLIAISVVAIVLYLCLSFSNAYGYQVGNLDRFNVDNTAEINWQSDSWLSMPGADLRSTEGNSVSASSFDFDNARSFNDGSFDDNEVCPTVPEPTIIILFGMGVGTLALYRKIRK